MGDLNNAKACFILGRALKRYQIRKGMNLLYLHAKKLKVLKSVVVKS